MLEGQHKPARSIGIERASRDSVMLRRISKARRTDRPNREAIGEGALARGAAWFARNGEIAPACGAKAGLGHQSLAAQRAAWRKQQIDDGRKERMDLHARLVSLARLVVARQGKRVTNSPPPAIFAPARRVAVRRRARLLRTESDAARYLAEDMAEDVLERLAFLRHVPAKALLIGAVDGALADTLTAQGCEVAQVDPADGWQEEQPFPIAGFDLIASLGTLDTLNDPVGALIHIRNALAPGGLALASLVGAGSLSNLRAAMLAADGDRPAPRLHPAIDVRAAAALLQRAGWADPVVDNRSLSVRFSGLTSLIADLRAQALSNCLASPGPPLTRAQRKVAAEAFGEGTTETFEILTLTGWKR